MSKNFPTKKWFAARVTALTGLALLVVRNGRWDTSATIMLITAMSAGAIAWLLPNAKGGD